MTIDHYNPTRDLMALADLLTLTLVHDTVTSSLVQQHTVGDPNFDPTLTLMARKGGQIVGFMQAVVRPSKDDTLMDAGWLKWFAVHPGYEGQGIATKLLDMIEGQLSGKVDMVHIMTSAPKYYMPGLDPRYTRAHVWLIHMGFEHTGANVNLSAELRAKSWDTSDREAELNLAGIDVRAADRSDFDEVIAFIEEKFPGSWPIEVAGCFENDPVTLHIALQDGHVVGFAAYDTVNIGLGWFGPMGTAPEMRGHGVGEVLFKRCLADQKRQGYSRSIIPWVGPIPFYYKHADAVVDRVFWNYCKKLA